MAQIRTMRKKLAKRFVPLVATYIQNFSVNTMVKNGMKEIKKINPVVSVHLKVKHEIPAIKRYIGIKKLENLYAPKIRLPMVLRKDWEAELRGKICIISDTQNSAAMIRRLIPTRGIHICDFFMKK